MSMQGKHVFLFGGFVGQQSLETTSRSLTSEPDLSVERLRISDTNRRDQKIMPVCVRGRERSRMEIRNTSVKLWKVTEECDCVCVLVGGGVGGGRGEVCLDVAMVRRKI